MGLPAVLQYTLVEPIKYSNEVCCDHICIYDKGSQNVTCSGRELVVQKYAMPYRNKWFSVCTCCKSMRCVLYDFYLYSCFKVSLNSQGRVYAGIYVPTLVSAITAHNAAIGKGASGTRINLKGFAVTHMKYKCLLFYSLMCTHRSAMDVLGRTFKCWKAAQLSCAAKLCHRRNVQTTNKQTNELPYAVAPPLGIITCAGTFHS